MAMPFGVRNFSILHTLCFTLVGMIDPEPMNERFVNFADFDVMAENWLKEYLWPTW